MIILTKEQKSLLKNGDPKQERLLSSAIENFITKNPAILFTQSDVLLQSINDALTDARRLQLLK